MKCPILSAPTARTAFTEHFADIDCLREECAWWHAEQTQCAMMTLARQLHNTWSTLQIIEAKMPHVGQFTK